jgi:hypothetical protein
MNITLKIILITFALGAYSSCFAIMTSTSYQVEDDRLVSGGGRQTADSYTNIGVAGQPLVPVRATATSYLADFGMAFWNPGGTGTLTVTDSSNNVESAEFTLAYSSADPDSPRFMVCYGTSQTDVEASCSGTATQVFTSAFSYEVTGLLNNTTYYFKVYPLAGYDASGNPILGHRYSATVSSSRVASTIFMPVSGSSGGGTSGGGGTYSYTPSVPSSPISNTPPTITPFVTPSIVDRVTEFVGELFGIGGESPAPVARAPIPRAALPAPVVTKGRVIMPAISVSGPRVETRTVPVLPTAPRENIFFQEASIEGTVFGIKGTRSVPLSGTKITLYECPSPSARPAGCTEWHAPKGQANFVISDAKGTFSFAAPTGIYYLRVVKTGYEPADSVPFPVTGSHYARIDMKPVTLLKRLFNWF